MFRLRVVMRACLVACGGLERCMATIQLGLSSSSSTLSFSGGGVKTSGRKPATITVDMDRIGERERECGRNEREGN